MASLRAWGCKPPKTQSNDNTGHRQERTKTMTTKEQERKALAQIEKIVSALGEDSYIKTAFAGCFEDARENIESDAAFSMKDRYEFAEREARLQRERAEEAEAKAAELEALRVLA